MSSNLASTLGKNIEWPLGFVWNHFTCGEEKVKGKYKAICNYCDKNWKHEELCELEVHLANYCSAVPNEIIREYLTKILSHDANGNEFNNKNNKRKYSNLSG